jgi:hypothetical protein
MWRTVAALSALWCVLVIAPAAIATSLFSISTDTSIGGAVVGVWIVGFLLQFAVFMVIDRKSPRDTTRGWFLAGIMPFAADWSAPASWWALVVCAAIVIGYAVLLSWQVYRLDWLRSNGVHARGVVVDVNRPWFNSVINNVYIRRTLRLRIERPDGVRPYEVRFRGTFMIGDIPSPGATLRVLIDPAHPKHVVVDSKPAAETQYAAARQTYHAAAPAAAPDITDQLRKLTTMHQEGDLTDAEFAAAKKRLLGT